MILRHGARPDRLALLDASRAAGSTEFVALTHRFASRPRPFGIQLGLLWSAALDGPKVHRPSARVPVKFRQVEGHELPELLATAAQMDPISPDALRRRYSLGRQCYAGWVDGSIATYGWLTRGREWVGEFERELNVADDEAYIWDCATLPGHRRQRLFSALVGDVAARLSLQGLRRLWIIAVVTAPAMKRGMAEAGFEPILTLTYVQFYRRQILLTIPASGAPSPTIAAARRLLKQESEHVIGPLLVGTARQTRLPDTLIHQGTL